MISALHLNRGNGKTARAAIKTVRVAINEWGTTFRLIAVMVTLTACITIPIVAARG